MRRRIRIRIKAIRIRNPGILNMIIYGPFQSLFFSSVANPDPGSGAFLWPLDPDPGWVKSQDPGSGMNNPDHIS
jgi:hypothetical protein